MININNTNFPNQKVVSQSDKFIGVKGDNKFNTRIFCLPTIFNGINISSYAFALQIQPSNANDPAYYDILTKVLDSENDKIYLTWSILSHNTKDSGDIGVSIRISNANDEVIGQTFIDNFTISPNIAAGENQGEIIPPSVFEQAVSSCLNSVQLCKDEVSKAETIKSETQTIKEDTQNISNDAEAIKDDTEGLYNATVIIKGNIDGLLVDASLIHGEVEDLRDETKTLHDNTVILNEGTATLKNETAQIKNDTQTIYNNALIIEQGISDDKSIIEGLAEDVVSKHSDVVEKTATVVSKTDIVIADTNTVTLLKEATDSNKSSTDASKATAEQKATIATEQALLAKYYAEQAQSIASSIPMRYYRKTVLEMESIANPIQGDLCYITDFTNGKSQLYVYDTTDWDADEINPEWVFLGNLEFANLDKATLLNILALATVAISGSYTDLINKPNRYESFITVSNGSWNYNDSDKIFLTTVNSLTISNMTVGAIGTVITEYNLVLTSLGTVKKSPDYDYITVIAGQIYIYSFLNAGTYIYITRTVGV